MEQVEKQMAEAKKRERAKIKVEGEGFVQEPEAYLTTPRKKDYYDFCYQLFEKHDIKSVLDIGTASGDFLYFMPSSIIGIGIDKTDELIAVARGSRAKRNLTFEVVDLLKDCQFSEAQFDAITCHGTLAAIKDYASLFKQIFRLQSKLVILNDFFNPSEMDIELGYKRAWEGHKNFNHAYNIRSIDTISRLLEDFGVKNYKFVEYSMNSNLDKSDDALRNYHVLVDGERVLTNGLGIILRGYNLIIYP